ncbi:hypothetical protein CCACVL1_18272 [Corchorus capsularis]|uniref:DUF4220 domain-containing protein n=1 Tax=Corchorus capsularis TaxID=210143 RepID=A0A1R3HM13_COCAP|nr:hypothetical protein CCACVL1_18272 [Corchorus capsularis]
MNPIPPWMRKLWDTWDVRAMILFSLTLQATLFILGERRKYTVKVWIRIILWFAYLIADWIATAALGKLSEAQAEPKPDPSSVLRAVWAPLLLLHLGGPDTITAYALEDNQLWKRQLLGLVVEVILVIYVLLLSWTKSWLSLAINFAMFVAGIIKYIERTWSLKLASSGLAEETIPVFDIDTLVEDPKAISDDEKLLVGYQFFSAFRPDITNYISTRENLSSSGTKLIIRFMDNIQKTGLWNVNMDYLLHTLEGLNSADLFEIIEVELGFLFDVLYTKAPITYTKLGFIFRFISVFCSSCALGILCFVITWIQPQKHYPIADVTITSILVIGAIVVELYALGTILSSNWAVLWTNSRNLRNLFPQASWIFRGETALEKHKLKDKLKWSTELDFDKSIITWHLVTDICFHGIENSSSSEEDSESKNTCKTVSDYVMYLLVMQPDMILPGYRKDFWFSNVSETLGGFFERQGISWMSRKEARKGQEEAFVKVYGERLKSRGALELEVNAWKIAEILKVTRKKWEILEAVWSEMMCYAAIACPHLNHARQLRRGGEFLTHLWLILTMSFLRDT